MTRAGLRYTRGYLTPGICSLIKPTAMERLMSFAPKIHSHVIIKISNLTYGQSEVVEVHFNVRFQHFSWAYASVMYFVNSFPNKHGGRYDISKGFLWL